LRGTAIVFDQTTTIGRNWGSFDEVIRREAVEKALARRPDIRALWNHDTNFVLGRTKSGTLDLRVTDRGLEVTIRPPATEVARHFHESVRRGDVDGMSFGFYVLDERVTQGGGKQGRDLREVLDIELFEVSPVTFPAYQDTEIVARGEAEPSGASQAYSVDLRSRQLALRKRAGGMV